MLERQQAAMDQRFEQINMAMQNAMQCMQQPPSVTINNGKRRKMSIMAPSGEVYEGTVEDEEGEDQ
jgi:hypothetical protein